VGRTAAALLVENLEVRYGAALAVRDVSFELPKGSVLAVLGTNGAGKSSVARACSGLVTPTRGSIRLDGADVTNTSAERIRRAGLVHLPEGRGIFPNLTVLENLKLAVYLLKDREEGLRRAFDLFPVLAQRRGQRAGSLSGGEQQMLSLARALTTNPQVVIVDEPSLGLAPKVVDNVFESLGRAKAEGLTIMIIEQFAHRALALADRCVVLRQGTVSWSGSARDAAGVLDDHYIGTGDRSEAAN
jgi:branched-chain amino acid transport system ATP-binding protein